MEEKRCRFMTFKRITGKRFEFFRVSNFNTEGETIAINHKYIASSWDGAHACIAIINKDNPKSIPKDIPLIRPDQEKNTDLQWSPFFPNLLSVGGSDGSIRLFNVPEEENFTKDIKQEDFKFSGHSKKVICLKFHPCSKDIVASCSFGKDVNTWNLETGVSKSILGLNDICYSLDWNYNGSLLGCCCKDKYSYILDPRESKAVLTALTHNFVKPQKLIFLDSTYFATFGLCQPDKREIKLYDIRNADTPCMACEVDESTSTMRPWYDPDTNVIIVPSKGERVVHFYAFENSRIVKLHDYTNENSFTFFAHSEKRHSDYRINEFFRFYSAEKNNLHLYSITMPRQDNTYDPSLFPPTFNGVSVISGADWEAGQDADYQLSRIEDISYYPKINPSDINNLKKNLNKPIAKPQVVTAPAKVKTFVQLKPVPATSKPTYDQEPEVTYPQVESTPVVSAPVISAPIESNNLEEQVKILTEKVEELTDQLNNERQINDQLREEIAALKAQFGIQEY